MVLKNVIPAGNPICIDWLIDYLPFYVPLKNISLIWRRHHCWWRAAKIRPMLGAQSLWTGMNLYRATPTVTRDLCFCSLIRRTAPFSRLLRHAWGRGGPILTRILTGQSNIHKVNPNQNNEGQSDTITSNLSTQKIMSDINWTRQSLIHVYHSYFPVISISLFLHSQTSTASSVLCNLFYIMIILESSI
jgi:hypothetical protein